MDEETRRQAASDRTEARRANNWRPVSWRSIGQVSDALIEKLQAMVVANDNKPSPRVRVHVRDEDD